MNDAQELWWRQARSDHAVFVQLRRAGGHECHLLHYLQMATEKLSKAYLWRSRHAPPRSHTGFVRFLRALLDRRDSRAGSDRNRFGVRSSKDALYDWVRSVQTLAYSLQNIAPAEAGNGPEPRVSLAARGTSSLPDWPHVCLVEPVDEYWAGPEIDGVRRSRGRTFRQLCLMASDQGLLQELTKHNAIR